MIFNMGPDILTGIKQGHIDDLIKENVAEYMKNKSPEEWKQIIVDYYTLPLGKRIIMNIFGGWYSDELFKVRYAKHYLRENMNCES